jgi:hypothetical protein
LEFFWILRWLRDKRRSAGGLSGDGFVLVVFGGWMGREPGLLIIDEARGLFANVTDGFKGKFAREVVDGIFGGLFQVGGPALGGVEEFGQRLADVAVVWAVVVEVVVELVGDGGELFEQVVGVLFATGFARMGEEVQDCLVPGVEEFDEDENAIVGKVGGLAELLDLAFREGRVGTLSVERQSESEENESEEETTKHWFLCRIDNGPTGMSLLREDGVK